MPSNSHAARLREMAAYERVMVRWHAETAPDRSRAHEHRSAALLAGAEALEACAKLRAFADELTAQNMPVLHGMAYQIDWLLPKKEKSDG